MLKTRVLRSWINDLSKTILLDSGEALHQWVLYYVVEHSTWYFDETEYRIVYDLAVVQISCLLADFGKLSLHLLLQVLSLLGCNLGKILAIASVDNATTAVYQQTAILDDAILANFL